MNDMRAERSGWRIVGIHACVATTMLWALSTTGCGGKTGGPPPADESGETAASRRIIDEIKGLYEKARSTDGSRAPGDIVEWLKADVQKMGTWEYKVVKIVEPEDLKAGEQSGESVESQLGKLGAEKWECFWMERRDAKTLYAYMKRRHRSYVETVPLTELIGMLRNTEGK